MDWSHQSIPAMRLQSRFGDRVKIGAGYNFTDYSDNLTDLGYRSRGFFVNTIARF